MVWFSQILKLVERKWGRERVKERMNEINGGKLIKRWGERREEGGERREERGERVSGGVEKVGKGNLVISHDFEGRI